MNSSKDEQYLLNKQKREEQRNKKRKQINININENQIDMEIETENIDIYCLEDNENTENLCFKLGSVMNQRITIKLIQSSHTLGHHKRQNFSITFFFFFV